MSAEQNPSLEELYLSQAYYVEKYLQTSESLEKQELYEKIANSVKGNTIIDAGCGDCRLIHHIKKKNIDATIIGIDINPLALMIGNDMLIKLGHNVNFHYGFNVAKDPSTGKISLISDIINEKIPFKFEKGNINLLQEDFRYGEVLRERLEKDLGLADVITYAMPGGFSPHIIFEKGEKNYNSVLSGIEMNEHVMALGIELLKDNGKMIWALRSGAKDMESLKDMDLDGLNLSIFKQYYNVNKVEVVPIDEQELKLDLPAYSVEGREVHYTNDIKKIKHDFKLAVVIIEMIKR